MRVEGYGGKPSVEYYPFQGLDIATRPYGYPSVGLLRQLVIESSRSLNAKYAGRVSPFGTPLADLVRTGGETLVVPCGNCGVTLARCGCSFRGPGE